MRDIKPLNVSPIIKTARWSLLFLGYIYGANRNQFLINYDKKLVEIRIKNLEERIKARMIQSAKVTRMEVRNLYEVFGEEAPPEWKD